ncbi:MAG: hypothetical protein M1833_005232 [Piccolia ochrophora]|nr:MAG: hypothetical protein M1833_005232 [Piccolia ochrophora]
MVKHTRECADCGHKVASLKALRKHEIECDCDRTTEKIIFYVCATCDVQFYAPKDLRKHCHSERHKPRDEYKVKRMPRYQLKDLSAGEDGELYFEGTTLPEVATLAGLEYGKWLVHYDGSLWPWRRDVVGLGNFNDECGIAPAFTIWPCRLCDAYLLCLSKLWRHRWQHHFSVKERGEGLGEDNAEEHGEEEEEEDDDEGEDNDEDDDEEDDEEEDVIEKQSVSDVMEVDEAGETTDDGSDTTAMSTDSSTEKGTDDEDGSTDSEDYREKWKGPFPGRNESAAASPSVRAQYGEDKKWCYCKHSESSQMVKCDNAACGIIWFHVLCTDLFTWDGELPEYWLCERCHSDAVYKAVDDEIPDDKSVRWVKENGIAEDAGEEFSVKEKISMSRRLGEAQEI